VLQGSAEFLEGRTSAAPQTHFLRESLIERTRFPPPCVPQHPFKSGFRVRGLHTSFRQQTLRLKPGAEGRHIARPTNRLCHVRSVCPDPVLQFRVNHDGSGTVVPVPSKPALDQGLYLYACQLLLATAVAVADSQRVPVVPDLCLEKVVGFPEDAGVAIWMSL